MSILVQGSRPGAGATARARRTASRMTPQQRARAARAAEEAFRNGASVAQANAAGLRAAQARRVLQQDDFNQAQNAFRRAIRAGQSRQQARRAAQRIVPGVTMAQLSAPRRRG